MSNVRINSGQIGFTADLVTPWGLKTVFLTEAEAAAYRSDPDGFAASTLGLDVESYREWINLKGAPLCSGVTQKGTRCGNSVSPSQLPADEWKALHRRARCNHH